MDLQLLIDTELSMGEFGSMARLEPNNPVIDIFFSHKGMHLPLLPNDLISVST